jgi:DNA-binding NarL/FixJ family response regulator
MTKNSLTAFVVDDSATLCERVVEMLAAIDGLEVIGQAQSAAEAVRAIDVLRPDVVILDIQMPGGSGFDVLREVKSDYPDTVVIMFTNHDEPQYKKRCSELKADYFLSKATGSKLLVEIGERLVKAKGSAAGD